MNIPMILVSSILVASTFLPFFILSKAGKSDLRKMSKQFKVESNQNHLKMTQKENWGNTVIGLDEENKKLLFSKVIEGQIFIETINLKEIKKSAIKKKSKEIRIKNKKETILERLDLELSYIKAGVPNKVLNFYDEENIYAEDYEVNRAQKWNTLINNNVDPGTADKTAG